MNEILLYLSLKYSGEWVAIYNSLKNRERITAENLEEMLSDVNCDYTTLLDDKYPEGLKAVYMPPFGLFTKGKYELLLNKNNVTVFGSLTNDNCKYIDEIRNNGGNILWVDLSNKELLDILSKYKKGNIFYLNEMKNNSASLKHIMNDEEVISNNLFISEIWEQKKDIDYSNQLQERMYMGITHKVLILDKLDWKRAYAVANYGTNEDIQFVIKASLYDDKFRKIFTRCKAGLVTSPKEIITYFFAQN